MVAAVIPTDAMGLALLPRTVPVRTVESSWEANPVDRGLAMAAHDLE
jgi:hypothetical protein